MEMGACSRRLSWSFSATMVSIVVFLQSKACCMSRLCLAGADFMLLMESVKLLLRHAWCSSVRVANGICEVAKTC